MARMTLARIGCILLTLAPATAAADFTVNSVLDLPDLTPLGDGQVDADLETEGAQITLRAAIQEANALAGPDNITLPTAKLKLTIKGADENDAATGDLDVASEITIFGEGFSNSIIDGKKAKDRVFDVRSGSLSIQSLTVRGGSVSEDENGGGIRVESGAVLTATFCTITKCKAADDGGGINVNGGTATINSCVISKNRAVDDGGGLVCDEGTLSVSRSTFVSNKAKDEGGGLEATGAEVELINCTFTKNKAKVEGGALSIEDGSEVEILNCTLARNGAKAGSGISEDLEDGLDDAITISNSIVANKKPTNYAGDGLTSGGHNLETGTTCGFAGTGDLSDTDPRLFALKDNGGATPTIALKDDSPAIDGGDDALAPEIDQRGASRVDTLPNPEISDIGAFEFGGVL